MVYLRLQILSMGSNARHFGYTQLQSCAGREWKVKHDSL